MAKAKNEKKTREVTTLRPFSDISRWDREMDRLFGHFFERRLRPFRGGHWWPGRGAEVSVPAVDLFEDNGDIVAKAELPGMEKEDIEVNITDNRLIIKGEKKKEQESREEDYYYSERSYGSFSRTIDLPSEVETGKSKATFKNGVLEIRIPKTEAAKKKEVKVKVE